MPESQEFMEQSDKFVLKINYIFIAMSFHFYRICYICLYLKKKKAEKFIVLLI